MKANRLMPILAATILLVTPIATAQQLVTQAPQASSVPTGRGKNLDQALQAAAESKKPVLVFFSSNNIPPCKAMKDKVLKEQEVRDAMAAFEVVDIDVDQQPEIAGKYKVNQLPVFMVLDAKGSEIDRFGGFLPPQAFIETLRDAADPSQSIPELNRRISASKDDLEARWLLARKYARDKNRDGLDKTLVEMRQLDPKNEKGYLDGVAFLELMTSVNPKMPEDGFKTTGRFLEEFPKSKFADQVELTRAQMAYQMGDSEKCIEIMESFAQKYPTSPLAEQVKHDLAAVRGNAQQK